MTTKAHGFQPGLNRRGMLRLLWSGAAGTVAAGLTHIEMRASATPAQATSSTSSLPRGIIRTISGDIDPASLGGATLMHEHLGTGSAAPAPGGTGALPPNPTTDAAWMADELAAAHKAGLRCIVAAQGAIPGPESSEYLRSLVARSGVQIVSAAAYLRRQNYPAAVATQSEDEIADDLVRGAARARLGAFGELGMANDQADLDPLERKVFRAFAKAQVRTGIPIFTHTNYATGPQVSMDVALRQLDALESAGGTPRSIAVGHMCCHYDPMVSVARRVAQRGAFVAFDRVTRQQQWVPDVRKVEMVKALLDAGLESSLLLSSDYIGRINTTTNEVSYPGPLHARDGGPGYARPLVLFVPLMRKAGIPEAAIRRVTEDNPRRFLTFVPRQA